MKKLLFGVILFAVSVQLKAQTPEAYYPFNGNALDSTGNGHHGTIMNGATLTADRFGQANSAYFFDGVDDYINLADPLGLQSNAYTFELWVKPASNPVGTAQCALSVGGNGGDQFITNISAGADVGWNISGYQNPAGTYDLVSGSAPVVNTWYHVIGVRDNGVARLYVNGILVDTATYSIALTPQYGQNFANIGRRTFNQFQYFHGAIDEVKIYNQALTPAQVHAIFNPSNVLTFAQASGTDAVTVPASPLTGMGGDFTLSLNAYFTNVNHWNMLFINNSGAGGAEFSYTGSGSNNPYTLQFTTDGSSANVAYAKSWIPQANTWYHIAFTRKANVYKAYVNGNLLDSNVSNVPFPNYNTQGLRIGNYFTGFASYNFQGKMDEVCYWNTALGAGFIQDSLAPGIFPNDAPGLVLRYKMDTLGFGAGLNVRNSATLGGPALNGTTIGSATTPYFSPAPANQTSPYRSCWEILQANPGSPSGTYTIDPDGPGGMAAFPCTCDMTTDGGGWTLVANYNHLAGTNPSVTYRNADLPVAGSSSLGVDESGTIYWGSATNGLMNQIPFDTMRWYGTSSQAGTVMHFKSGAPSALAMAKTGTGDYSAMNTSKVVYPDNTAVNINCIGTSGAMNNAWATLMQCFGIDMWSVGISGSGACTGAPGWPNIWQWSIDNSYCTNAHPNSLHRIWVKGPNPCNQFSTVPAANVVNSPNFCADGNWKHISNPGNAAEIIASVDDNGLNLGNLLGSVYLEPGNTGSYNGQYFLKRHYVIQSQFNPLGAKRIRLYFTTTEWNALQGAEPGLLSKADLKVTKYSGPTADGVYNPADATSITLIPPAAIDTGSAYGLHFLEFDVNGFSEFWIHGGSNAPLPVHALTFEARWCGIQSCLQWRAEGEDRLSHYSVERSADGYSFSGIGQLKAAGEKQSTVSYAFEDTNPLSGRNYYRLKAVDEDGKFSYSSVVLLEQGLQGELLIVPTRSADGRYRIKTDASVQDYQVLNMSGQCVLQRSGTSEIDLGAFPRGIYAVRIRVNGATLVRRVIRE